MAFRALGSLPTGYQTWRVVCCLVYVSRTSAGRVKHERKINDCHLQQKALYGSTKVCLKLFNRGIPMDVATKKSSEPSAFGERISYLLHGSLNAFCFCHFCYFYREKWHFWVGKILHVEMSCVMQMFRIPCFQVLKASRISSPNPSLL